MPLFEYEAKTIQGRLIKGKMEAVSKHDLSALLREKGYFPTRITQKSGILNSNIEMMQKVTTKDIAIFCKQFSVIISAGVPILRALEIVKRQTENKKLQKVLSDVVEDVKKGTTLSFSMKKNKDFPDMLSNMIAVGEASGTLDVILARMAVFYEKETDLNRKIKSATTYPVVICVVAIVVVIFLVTKIVPIFSNMLTSSGGTLPLPTKILMDISHFINTQWYILVIVTALLFILVKIYIKSTSGRFTVDHMKLNLPLFGKLYRKLVTARFARTFGTLISSGIPVLSSIDICSNVIGNVVVQNTLTSTQEEIKKGLGLGETLETTDIFPPMLTQMIMIGEEAGTLDEVLESTAGFYDKEVDAATEQMTNLIQPIILVVLGVVIAYIIISILLPMMDLYSTIA